MLLCVHDLVTYSGCFSFFWSKSFHLKRLDYTFLSMTAVLEQEYESDLDDVLGLKENQWPPMQQNDAIKSCYHMRDRSRRIYRALWSCECVCERESRLRLRVSRIRRIFLRGEKTLTMQLLTFLEPLLEENVIFVFLDFLSTQYITVAQIGL